MNPLNFELLNRFPVLHTFCSENDSDHAAIGLTAENIDVTAENGLDVEGAVEVVCTNCPVFWTQGDDRSSSVVYYLGNFRNFQPSSAAAWGHDLAVSI